MRRNINKTKKKISLSFKLLYFVILTLIIVSFSMARYKTTYEGNIQGDTAKWVFKVNGEEQSFTLNLADTAITNLEIAPLSNRYAHDRGVIAPCAKGEFTIVLDCTDCDVAIDYEINIKPHTQTTLPKELYIYSTTLEPNKTTILNKTIKRTITLAQIQENSTININVQWMWQVNRDKSESNFEGQNLQIDITVTGKQHINEGI
ncbi:MAG: hypothetical protein Q4G09_06375 [Clostridia bacterium]|nr:hypothetical protein [Clostridia bacterium]